MSGDVQPRKRKDKRKKRDDDDSSSHGVHITKMGNDDVHLHVQHQHGTGGHWCAKIIFFSLMAVLLGLVGLIIMENRGMEDLDTPLSESRYSNYFDGWVEEHRPEEHDEHDAPHSHEAALDDEHDDEVEEPYEQQSGDEEEIDQEHDEDEQEEEDEEEENTAAENLTAEDDEDDEIEESADRTQSLADDAEEEEEEADEEEEDEDADEDIEESIEPIASKSRTQSAPETAEEDEDDDNIDEEEEDEEENEEEDQAESIEPTLSKSQAADDDDEDEQDNDDDAAQEEEEDFEESVEPAAQSVADDGDDDEFEQDDNDEDEFESLDQEVDNQAEQLKAKQAKDQAAEENIEAVTTTSWLGSLAVKFGVGIALALVSRLVLVRNNPNTTDEQQPTSETHLRRRLTIATAEDHIPDDDTEELPPLDDEAYSEEEIEIEEEIEVEISDIEESDDNVALTAGYVPETFEQLSAMFRPKTELKPSDSASDKEPEPEVEPEREQETEPEAEAEGTAATDIYVEYEDGDIEDYEHNDSEDDDELISDEEEDEISDVDDADLMSRLEAKYGRLPAKEYESDPDSDDPSWTQIKPKEPTGAKSVEGDLFEQELRRAQAEMINELNNH